MLAIKLAAVAAWLGSGVACVDSSHPSGPTCAVPAPVPYSGDAVIPSTDTAAPGPYAWKNVVIKGGGFVTGIIMSPVLPGLVFARTDVGGAYRYDPAGRRWMAITDWVGHNDSNLLGIESIAADPVDPNRVYLAAGMYLTAGNGAILSSTDMGQTWARNSISAPMGGNADGRSVGERLAIDPNLTSILYFGSRTAGLWTSTDFAQTWTKVGGFPKTSAGTEYGLTFVVFDPSSGSPGSPTQAIYIGVQGSTGTGLYRTTDAGVTWQEVAGQPTGQPTGLTPHHAVPDRCGNLYLAYNNGPGPNSITSGAIWQYSMTGGDWTNVMALTHGYGLGGIAADAANPGTFILTTIDGWGADEIYRTTNGGQSIPTWARIGSAATRDVAGAAWVLGHPPKLGTPGWMGDVEIDPFDPAHALYITGGGIWSSDDVTDADKGISTHWTFDDDGLEETVVSDLASPPTGAPLLSAVGDISGFRHDDLDVSPPGGMFDGFVNTTSLDFAEAAPDIFARVGSNGGSYSTDGGTTWTPFVTVPAASQGSGSIAVSADGTTFLWAPQVPRGATTKPLPSLSRDHGATWTAVGPAAGAPAPGAQVAADRVNPSKFYASDGTGMYVSIDGGANFVLSPASPSGRPRPVFGIEGDVWVAANSGLFHSQDSAATFARVGGPDSSPYQQVGFGMAAPGQSYPAVYLAGSVAGVWGTYRSDDVGVTWQRIDDPQHQFGWIHCLTGDQRQYGRVYLGTGGRGILYGDPR